MYQLPIILPEPTAAACTKLQKLDLSRCRTALDANNTIPGVCSVSDVHAFARSSELTQLMLPVVCAIRLGKIHHTFPKTSVAVVNLSLPLALGDIVELRRLEQTDFQVSHEWRSVLSVVRGIRTDDHRQLTVAVPSGTNLGPSMWILPFVSYYIVIRELQPYRYHRGEIN